MLKREGIECVHSLIILSKVDQTDIQKTTLHLGKYMHYEATRLKATIVLCEILESTEHDTMLN